MSKNIIKVGFIGAGFIGQIAHIDNFSQLDTCELTAIAELRPKLRAEVAQKYNFKQQYSNHRELLEHSNVDAVVVVTSRALSASVVFDCLNAGKHVFCEKPMAGTYLEGIALVNAAKKNGVRYCVGYMKRYDAGVLYARSALNEILLTQELGLLLHVRASCYMGHSYCKAKGNILTDEKLVVPPANNMAPDWLDNIDKPTFARYVNVYSHLTNLLSFLFNKQPKVEYFNFLSNIAHTCVLNYNDFLATIDTGEISNRDWEEEIKILFEHGHLVIKLPPALLRNVPASVEIYKAGDIQQLIIPKIDWSWSFRNQAVAFIDDLITGNASNIDGSFAAQDLALIEEIWKSKC